MGVKVTKKLGRLFYTGRPGFCVLSMSVVSYFHPLGTCAPSALVSLFVF